MNDLRHALRMARTNPGFTLTAVLTLALGLGAVSAIFTVVYAVLLRPLPFPDPDQLVMVWMQNEPQQIDRDVTSYPTFADWRSETRTLEHVVGVIPTGANLTGDGDPEVVGRIQVTEGFFAMLGVPPALGRAFQPEDHVPGSHQVAVLSDGLWRRRYAADPGVVGRTVLLNDLPFTVVGIARATGVYPADADLWTPLGLTGGLAELAEARGALWLPVVGRLRDGVTLAQAQTDMSTIARNLEERFPGNQGQGVLLEPLHDTLVRDVRPALLVLFAAVGFVLLLVTANMANLLLARGIARRRDLAVRRALGAGRRHLLRQVVAESVMLGLAGGVSGMVLAFWTVGAARSAAPAGLDWLAGVTIHPAVPAFTLLVALLTSVACALPSALRASQGDPRANLGEGDRGGTAGRATGRVQRGLVATQVGLAVLLLVGAGLMTRSVLQLQAVDPGHEVDRILTFELAVPAQRYPDDAAVRAVYDDVLGALRAVPGVESADAISDILLGRLSGSAGISLDDESARTEAERLLPISYDFVTAGFFETMGIPVRLGRPFDATDRPGGPPTAIVNETFATRFFPGADPIGRRWTFGNNAAPDAEWFTIVGVVADTRRTGLDRPERPLIYLPTTQAPARAMTVVVRAAGSGDPIALAPLARRALASVDPALPLTRLRSVAQLLGESVADRRFLTVLLVVFGALAVAVSAVGVYGVLAYQVGQRTREIGVRLALGARTRDVLRQVLATGMASVTVGLAVGLAAALVLSRLLVRFLFEVSPADPATLAGVMVLLAGVATLACWLPARRAARIDPMEALRHE